MQQTEVAGRSFDVVIVGSGASGGWAAKRLTEAGLRVAVLEAGRQLTDADYKEHVPVFGLPYRARTKHPLERERPVQAGSYAVREWNAAWYVNDFEEPYVDESNPHFLWVRPRIVGGRTNIWGRACLRFSDIDFKAHSHDGAGVDWPISYKDIAPYYDLVEEYVGVSAMLEGNDVLPDGKFLPPMGFSCAEMEVRNRIKAKFDRLITQGRTANLSKPHNGRAPCHYCGPCEHGCVTHSYFSSTWTTMADAAKTGKCTLITGAMAYKVIVDPATRRAKGITYVDRATRQVKEVYGRVVALCAQTQESVRILFNSATTQDAGGLANSSGMLGKYLMTHFSDSGASGDLTDLKEVPTYGDANRPCQGTLVRFRNLPGKTQTKGFLRGYGMGVSANAGFDFDAPGFGEAYKKAVGGSQPVSVNFAGYGECLPYEDNYCFVDKNVVDAFGIPVIRLRLAPRENELTMLKDMGTAAAEMLESLGAKNINVRNGVRGQAHELGAARMGNDPKTSVLTPFLQTHDIKNLFVMDGSSFCSVAWQNPTLTIMALAVRATDFMQDAMKKGDI
jgi:choline dehydrogenase-like flavoprotein